MKKLFLILAVYVMLNNGKIYFYPGADRWEVESASFGPSRTVDVETGDFQTKLATFTAKDVKMVSKTDPREDTAK